jgi:hypothetical protein
LTDAFLRTENSRPVMLSRLKRLIRQGTIPSLKVIRWAHAGAEVAHTALCEVAAEMLNQGEDQPANIRYYAAHALTSAPPKRGKGGDEVENWLRDQCIAIVVSVVVEHWHPHLSLTRNRASKKPSACALVSDALVRRGINIGERRVEKIYKEYADLLLIHLDWQARLAAVRT